MSNNRINIFQNSWLELIFRLSLGSIFLISCYHKILEPAHFAKIIYGYYLFPDFSINLIAIILPFLELVSGLALIFGICPRSAALSINALLLAFIVAVSINLIRGHEFDCGCFSFGGSGQTSPTVQLLIRDVILLGIGLQLLFFDKHRKGCVLQSGSILRNY